MEHTVWVYRGCRAHGLAPRADLWVSRCVGLRWSGRFDDSATEGRREREGRIRGWSKRLRHIRHIRHGGYTLDGFYIAHLVGQHRCAHGMDSLIGAGWSESHWV